MPSDPEALVVLFQSLTQVMRAERLLLEGSIPHKLVPTPKRLSSECGVSIRILAPDRARVLQALDGKVDVAALRPLS